MRKRLVLAHARERRQRAAFLGGSAGARWRQRAIPPTSSQSRAPSEWHDWFPARLHGGDRKCPRIPVELPAARRHRGVRRRGALNQCSVSSNPFKNRVFRSGRSVAPGGRVLLVERGLAVAQFGDLGFLIAQLARVVLHDLLLAADLERLAMFWRLRSSSRAMLFCWSVTERFSASVLAICVLRSAICCSWRRAASLMALLRM